MIAESGLRGNNIADAFAFYWTAAWLGSRGRNDDLPRSQLLAVRDQVAEALLLSGNAARLNDATKQQTAEAYLLSAAMIKTGIQQIKTQPAMLRRMMAWVTAEAKASDLDLASITLEADGFHSRKGSDAGDALDIAPEAIPPALAAIAPSASAPAVVDAVALKQELAEGLILQALLIDSWNEKAREDPKLRRTLSNAVKQGAKTMGLDLAAMTLTADGFRPRKVK